MARRSVFCMALSESQALEIVDQLKLAGFSSDDISVLFPDKSGTRDFGHEQHTKAPEGAATGVSAGGLLGGTLGWLAGIGALAIPGVGPLIAAGPIMAALSGAAVGAAVGGITGALVGMGIPEFEAKRYEGKIREGNILISVHTDDSNERARAKERLRAGRAPKSIRRRRRHVNKSRVKELMLNALETELGGVQIYETAIRCAINEDLRKEWKEYHEQTEHHGEVVRGVCEALGF